MARVLDRVRRRTATAGTSIRSIALAARRRRDPRVVVLTVAAFAVLAGVVVGTAARWPTAGVVVSFVLAGTAAVVIADNPAFRAAVRRLPRRVAAGARGLFADDARPSTESGLDPAELHLRRADLLVDGEADVPRVDPAFERTWRRRMVSMGDRSEDPAALADLLSVPAREVDLSWEADDGTLVASVRDRPAGRWPSRAAFLADVTAVEEFRTRFPEWWTLDPMTRVRVLAALRLRLDWCPVCDGAISVSRVGSPATGLGPHPTPAHDSTLANESVLAATCDACASRLFEASVEPVPLDRPLRRDADAEV
ncbi:hypothetical protein NDI76_09975 [Halogeometricum sp. S1BR25-6]|uniref:DUF8054 domain-containing protein n=1 Tax=Halogeometricum salsisoli TaxID=2950536 RepID=A0ABU2GE33_9EURY|nr:hypothetical protein [Halogeometricum sp. S1BR25-6]MDS0299070.1 hypothetical protein [Halogeometricum sp. S1BR25-6]